MHLNRDHIVEIVKEHERDNEREHLDGHHQPPTHCDQLGDAIELLNKSIIH